MALGFILFALFFVALIIVLTLAIIILVFGCKFILKYKNDQSYKHKKIRFAVSILGVSTSSILLLFIFIKAIEIFVLPIQTTEISLRTSNTVKEITDIALIEQSIGGSTYVSFHFFKESRQIMPRGYFIKFINISDDVERIRINSIYLVIDGIDNDIIGNREREFVPSDVSSYDSESYMLSYDFSLNYETMELVIITYNIDIELNNGEIINVEEQADFVKEIVHTFGKRLE